MITGVDLSHFQGSPDFAAIKASGHDFVILKATEGTTYIDPVFATNRTAAHAAGLIVGLYHFGHGDTVAAEAAFFLKTIGALLVGEFLVLDDEVPAITPAWAKAWNDAVYAATTVKPLDYMNRSTQNAGDWAPVVADNDGEWLASYDGNPAVIPAGGPWGSPAMKQYTSSGTVAGIAGLVDLDVFYGTDAQLLAFGLQPAPIPAPTVQEDDMRLIRTPDGTIWKVTDLEVVAEGNNALAGALGKTWGAYVDVTQAEKDLIEADANARAARYLGNAQNYILGEQPGTDQTTWLLPLVNEIAGKVTALAAQVAAAPGMTCQGSPKAVLGAIGQAATAAASTP